VLPARRLIRKLISLYATSMNIELQQRSIEFGALFRSQEQIRLVTVASTVYNIDLTLSLLNMQAFLCTVFRFLNLDPMAIRVVEVETVVSTEIEIIILILAPLVFICSHMIQTRCVVVIHM